MNNEFITNFYKMSPKKVEGVSSNVAQQYFFELLAMVQGCYKFDNLPETFSEDIMKLVFICAPLAAFDTSTQGIYCLPCSFTGYDINYSPTKAIISNPVLKTREFTIGKDCELFYIDKTGSYFDSLADVLTRYAVRLAMIDASVDVNLMNSRVAQVFKASNRAQLLSLKRMYDDISRGHPAVFMRKGIDDDSEWALFNNVKNTYIVNDLLMSKRTIIQEFLTYIGINSANIDKRERLNTDEVHANDGERLAHCETWLHHMQECAKKINSRFSTDIKIEYSDVVKNGGDVSESIIVDGSAQ